VSDRRHLLRNIGNAAHGSRPTSSCHPPSRPCGRGHDPYRGSVERFRCRGSGLRQRQQNAFASGTPTDVIGRSAARKSGSCATKMSYPG
jgi:hypothetical protein